MQEEAHSLVIVGAGQGGFQLAASARAAGFTKPIILIGDEGVAPYGRPPLSKAFLLDKLSADGLALQPGKFYEHKQIHLMLGVAVDGIDRKLRCVHLADGRRIDYGHLVLATGSRPRQLPFAPITTDNNIHQLRDLHDAQRLKTALSTASKAVVIGGGFIGLEFAAVARLMGLNVHVVEAAPRVMFRSASPTLSTNFEQMHLRQGVQIHTSSIVKDIVWHGPHATGIQLESGEILDCDLVLVGVGGRANDELAAETGLPTSDGVLVDAYLQTSDPFISAIGDCARITQEDDSVRMESVQNAVDQAKYVARRMTEHSERYGAVAWFWSEQYQTKLQIAGLVERSKAQVVRGLPAEGRYSICHFDDQRLVAVESVNEPSTHVAARQILERRLAVTIQDIETAEMDLRMVLRQYA